MGAQRKVETLSNGLSMSSKSSVNLIKPEALLAKNAKTMQIDRILITMSSNGYCQSIDTISFATDSCCVSQTVRFTYVEMVESGLTTSIIEHTLHYRHQYKHI